jgi:hypothetical protein
MQDPLVILFVNNIDSGVLLSLHDYSASKSDISGVDASPLSAITHSPVGIKKEWKRFLKDLSIPSRSLDRNEFTTEFGNRPVELPVVLLKRGTELSILVSAEEIRACRELSDLIHLIRERISKL